MSRKNASRAPAKSKAFATPAYSSSIANCEEKPKRALVVRITKYNTDHQELVARQAAEIELLVSKNAALASKETALAAKSKVQERVIVALQHASKTQDATMEAAQAEIASLKQALAQRDANIREHQVCAAELKEKIVSIFDYAIYAF